MAKSNRREFNNIFSAINYIEGRMSGFLGRKVAGPLVPPSVPPSIPPITLPLVYHPVTPPIDPRITPLGPPVAPPARPPMIPPPWQHEYARAGLVMN